MRKQVFLTFSIKSILFSHFISMKNQILFMESSNGWFKTSKSWENSTGEPIDFANVTISVLGQQGAFTTITDRIFSFASTSFKNLIFISIWCDDTERISSKLKIKREPAANRNIVLIGLLRLTERRRCDWIFYSRNFHENDSLFCF